MEHIQDTDEIKSDYELLRESKIARNQKRLAELGLHNKPPALRAPNNEIGRSTTKPRLLKETSELAPTRRSQRSCAIAQRTVSDSKVSDQGRNDIQERTEDVLSALELKRPEQNSRKRQRPATERSTSDSIPLGGKIITRFIHLNLDEIISSYLGQQLEESGKAAVVYESAKFSQHQNVTFNKYAGVLEWKNALFLWVNLNQGETINEFLQDGKQMTWFGGSSMNEKTPVIQRLIAVGKQAALAKENGAMEEHVILWVRYFDKRGGLPYICLGRCGYQSHEPTSQPLKFIWNLLDYEELMVSKVDGGESVFKRILDGGS